MPCQVTYHLELTLFLPSCNFSGYNGAGLQSRWPCCHLMGTGRELRSQSASLYIYYSLNLYQWTSVSWIMVFCSSRRIYLKSANSWMGVSWSIMWFFSLESLLNGVVLYSSCPVMGYLFCWGSALFSQSSPGLPVEATSQSIFLLHPYFPPAPQWHG